MPSGWLGLDWGNVPAWVGSVLTGSSLTVAAFTYRRSVAEKAREQTDREQQQASKVTAWEYRPGDFNVKNANDVAVIVRAFLDFEYQRLATESVSLGPEETRRLVIEQEAYAEYAADGNDTSVGRLPSLVITDSSGRTWTRDFNGLLTRVPDGDLERLRDGLECDGSMVLVEASQANGSANPV